MPDDANGGPAYALYLQLIALPPEDQFAFGFYLLEDKQSHIGQFLDKLVKRPQEEREALNALKKKHDVQNNRAFQQIITLRRMLLRHRNPRKNADRDAEIKVLQDAGKTAWFVYKSLKTKYPKLTYPAVRNVYYQNRKKSQSG